MNGQLKAGSMVLSKVPLDGRCGPCRLNATMSSIPIQKNGIAEVITNTGGRMLSSQLPRRHAPTMPMPVPSRNARMVVTPTRPSVHGSALLMI